MRRAFRKGTEVEVMGKKYKSKTQAMFGMFRKGYAINDISKKLNVERKNVMYTLRHVRRSAKHDPKVIAAFVKRNFGKV